MPESPEIAITSQYLLSKIKNRIFLNIELLSGIYTKKPFDGILKLVPEMKIIDINSKGKLLWFEFMNDKTKKSVYLINNLGLTGEWKFKKDKFARIKLIIGNKSNDKKYNLYYSDQLSFGKIFVTDNKKVLDKKLDDLSMDYLKEEFTENDFKEKYFAFLKKYPKKNNLPLIKFLMGQKKNEGIGCGLGNYLAPEILYHSKLAPQRELSSLTKKELETLSKSIKYIIKLSYYNNSTGYMTSFGSFTEIHRKGIESGKYKNYHPKIKFTKNDKFKFNVYMQKTDPLGNIVLKDKTINQGRTTYWVKEVQD